MSFILTVWEQPPGLPLPVTLDEAEAQLERVQAAPAAPPNPKFLAFSRALEERFPTPGKDEEGDEAVYDSGPLPDDDRPTDQYLNIGLYESTEWDAAYAHAVVQANDHGLHLFDMQAGAVYLANGEVYALDEPDRCLRAIDAWRRRDFAAAWAEYRRLAPLRDPKALQGWGQLLSNGSAGPRYHALGAALMELGGADADQDPEGYGVALRRLTRSQVPEQARLLALLRQSTDLAAAVDEELASRVREFDQVKRAILVPAERNDAVNTLMKLALSGYAPAAYRVSIERSLGKAMRASQEEAEHWLETAARWGSPGAQYELGMKSAKGGSSDQLAEAEKWLQRALAGGVPNADQALASVRAKRAMLVQRTADIASADMRARAGDPEAQFLLAQTLLEPEDPSVPAHVAAGLPWLERAARQGHLGAAAKLGDLLAWGRPGLAPDPARAMPWLEQAAAGDHVGGLVSIARVLKSAELGRADPARALECATRAAVLKSGDGLYLLALCLRDGAGGHADPIAAKAAMYLSRFFESPLRDNDPDGLADFEPTPDEQGPVYAVRHAMSEDIGGIPGLLAKRRVIG